MKFWKIGLLTTLSFFGFIAIFLYSSCERNTCNNVTCFNGGSCNVGTCHCPTGWEGPQCGSKAVDRFIHGYKGLTQCNMGAYVIDSAWIVGDIKNINFVYITQKSYPGVVLHGYISNNAATYSIIVASDSSANYLRVHTITLQNSTTLSIHTFLHDQTRPGDTATSECLFTGTKY
jgi:hypothetical protein